MLWRQMSAKTRRQKSGTQITEGTRYLTLNDIQRTYRRILQA